MIEIGMINVVRITSHTLRPSTPKWKFVLIALIHGLFDSNKKPLA
jgi:hypothetical protein